MTHIVVDEDYAEGLKDLLRGHSSRPGEYGDPAPLLREVSAGGWLELAGLGFSESREVGLDSALLACEVFGRENAPFSLVTAVGFIAPLLSGIGHETRFAAAVSDWIAEGKAVAIPVGRPRLTGSRTLFGLDGEVRSELVDGKVTLSGFIERVTDATAEFLITAFNDGAGIAVVPLASAGVVVTRLPTVVPGLEVASIRLDAVAIEADLIHAEAVADHIRRASGIWSLVLDAYAVGISRELVERTVAYASSRVQFGQVIGSFQSVQHTIADMHVAAETSFGMLREASRRWAAEAHDAVPYVVASRLHCAPSAVTCCESAIQMHGGAGFTWEMGLHYWYRSAQFLLRYLTDETALREVMVAHISSDAEAASRSKEEIG